MLDFGFYNMDCMEGMKEFPDKYFELAIVDPPYGDGGVLGRTERDSENGSTGTAYKLPREMLPSRGGTDTSQTDCERVKVHRVGGTWATKFGKKS